MQIKTFNHYSLTSRVFLKKSNQIHLKLLKLFKVQATSGVNAGFRFVGNGNLAYDEKKTASGCSYGGLLYAYNDYSIRFWQPGPGNGVSNGALICIADGMGGGKNVQASTEGVAVYYTWDFGIVHLFSSLNSDIEIS